jgi:hypothetical protein
MNICVFFDEFSKKCYELCRFFLFIADIAEIADHIFGNTTHLRNVNIKKKIIKKSPITNMLQTPPFLTIFCQKDGENVELVYSFCRKFG